jgi:hypothetical protein
MLRLAALTRRKKRFNATALSCADLLKPEPFSAGNRLAFTNGRRITSL